MWLQGRIVGVYNNGPYDVDLYRGPMLKSVVRQHLRPWRKGSVTWPSKSEKSCAKLKSLLGMKDKKGHTPLTATIKPVDFGSYESCKMANLLIENGAVLDDTTIALVRPESDFMRHLKPDGGESNAKMASNKKKKANSLPGLDPISHEGLMADTKVALIELEAKGIMKQTNKPPKINPSCELKAIGLRVLSVLDKSKTDIPAFNGHQYHGGGSDGPPALPPPGGGGNMYGGRGGDPGRDPDFDYHGYSYHHDHELSPPPSLYEEVEEDILIKTEKMIVIIVVDQEVTAPAWLRPFS